jgi:ketosteroid isomerase-like protein
MKITFIALMALGVAVPAVAQQPVIDTVRRLDAGWARAYQMHDTAYALQLFADDLVVTSTNGTLKNKQGEMADIRAQANLKMDFFRTRDVNVRVYPGAAVVTGLAEWSFTFNGRASQVARRYTSVFARGGPLGWRMVALHIGRAPE